MSRPLPAAWVGHLFDAATLGAQLLFFDALVSRWETVWVGSFPLVYAAFCAGLALKRYEPAYVAGLDVMWKRHPALTTLAVYIGGTMVGALGVASMTEVAYHGHTLGDVGPALGVPIVLALTFAAPIAHAWAMHRAKAHPRPVPRPAAALTLRLLSSAAVFAATLYLLAFVYRMIQETSGGGTSGVVWTALKLFVALTMLVLFYLPGRIHTLIEAPTERGNWVSFWLTCVAAAGFAVFGVHVGF